MGEWEARAIDDGQRAFEESLDRERERREGALSLLGKMEAAVLTRSRDREGHMRVSDVLGLIRRLREGVL